MDTVFLIFIFLFLIGMGLLANLFLFFIGEKDNKGRTGRMIHKFFPLLVFSGTGIFLAALVLIFHDNPSLKPSDAFLNLKWNEFFPLLFARYKNAFVVLVLNFLSISFCVVFMLKEFFSKEQQEDKV